MASNTDGNADKASIGLIGLGTMGAALALNIADSGHTIAVTNRTTSKIGAFVDAAGPLAERLVPKDELADFVAAIARPRVVIAMIQAGKPVDDQIDALMPLLDPGDTIVDAGNANYRDTERRAKLLDGTGVHFVGLGVSGGEEGARYGPSMMMGGSEESWNAMREVLEAIAARYEGDPCVDRLGPRGAGHFVKTIHNGIEYADMQMIAEVYGLMRDGLGMSAGEMAPVFARWNEGPLRSYLIEITAKVLEVEQDGEPIVDRIVDRAGQKGTGRWASIEAIELGIPATAITEAVAARAVSSLKQEREAASEMFADTSEQLEGDRSAIIADLEKALLAGKIAAYAQGFAVIAAASDEQEWNVPLARVAEIWRAGCIIRSDFLSTIAEALSGKGKPPANLIVTSTFADMVRDALPALRQTVGRAATGGHPVPALGSALSYIEDYRRARGTANLIQAQRDFFGAHGFEFIGEDGEQHGPWAMSHQDPRHEAQHLATDGEEAPKTS